MGAGSEDDPVIFFDPDTAEGAFQALPPGRTYVNPATGRISVKKDANEPYPVGTSLQEPDIGEIGREYRQQQGIDNAIQVQTEADFDKVPMGAYFRYSGDPEGVVGIKTHDRLAPSIRVSAE